MKIEFTFDNITQLEELYYAVENIPREYWKMKKNMEHQLKRSNNYDYVIMKLKSKLEEIHTTMEEE